MNVKFKVFSHLLEKDVIPKPKIYDGPGNFSTRSKSPLRDYVRPIKDLEDLPDQEKITKNYPSKIEDPKKVEKKIESKKGEKETPLGDD